MCTAVLIGWDPATPPPPIFWVHIRGRYWYGQPRWTITLCEVPPSPTSDTSMLKTIVEDPWHFATDPNPYLSITNPYADPRGPKTYRSGTLVHLHHSSKIKKIIKSQNSMNHKVFLAIFAWWRKDLDPYLGQTDRNGPKTNWSGTLLNTDLNHFWEHVHILEDGESPQLGSHPPTPGLIMTWTISESMSTFLKMVRARSWDPTHPPQA